MDSLGKVGDGRLGGEVEGVRCAMVGEGDIDHFGRG